MRLVVLKTLSSYSLFLCFFFNNLSFSCIQQTLRKYPERIKIQEWLRKPSTMMFLALVPMLQRKKSARLTILRSGFCIYNV